MRKKLSGSQRRISIKRIFFPRYSIFDAISKFHMRAELEILVEKI